MPESRTTSTPRNPVSLREVTQQTVDAVLKLRVTKDQDRFVASNAVSIAQAHFSPHAWFRAIYAGETPVGFLMLSIQPEQGEYFLWRFMVDAQHQGRGYGRRALELLVKHVKGLPHARELTLSHVPGAGSPEGFYRKLGFAHTGAEKGGELMMRLALQ
ncbi:MAG: GNAT family N-acetyltransferase [Gammaproteobacteria bacterium]|nr:GNAT family N-acetyltransferase [Gammaproteobacteria bacterium]